MLGSMELFIMLIDTNNSRTFRPVAIMIVGKSKLMHLDHFGSVHGIEERTCIIHVLRSEIINSLPAANTSLKGLAKLQRNVL